MLDAAPFGVLLLLAVMSIKSKQRTATVAKEGRGLAEWLNRDDTHSRAASLIQAVTDLHQWFPAGVAGWYFPKAGFRANLKRGTLIPVNLRAELRPRGRGITFSLVPADEDSRWLQVFGELCNSGNLSRFRRCPNCQRFWYCEGRSDRRACSVACKVALWQKTPAGRKAKREYMRGLRAKHKKLWEAKQQGRTLKRGRNLHVSLKKGE
jgi:hypothetical protein